MAILGRPRSLRETRYFKENELLKVWSVFKDRQIKLGMFLIMALSNMRFWDEQYGKVMINPDVFVCPVDKVSIVLPIRHKLEPFEKRERQLRKWHHRLACGKACREFSWLMINKGGLSSFWVVPPLGGWSWVIQESSLSKPHCQTPSRSLRQFLPSGSCLELLSWLPSVMRVCPEL